MQTKHTSRVNIFYLPVAVLGLLVMILTVSCLSGGQTRKSETPMLDDIVATKADSGKSWTFFKGSTFTIKLEGNPTTGYQWALLPESQNDLVMKAMGEAVYEPSKPVLTGSGGSYTFTFMAANPGTAVLRFGYARSWEKNPPIELATYTVIVKDVH